MDELHVLRDANNKIAEYASIRGNLTEKEIDRNLCVVENENKSQNFKLLEDQQINLEPTANMMNNLSSDDFLSSTREDQNYSDEEFDLQIIKHDALNSFKTDFQKDELLCDEYDCTYLANDFFHEEVYDENELKGCSLIDLNYEISAEIKNECIEQYKYTILSDHNYMGQEMDPIELETSIKNLKDLKNYNMILDKFIQNYENSSLYHANSIETKNLIREMSEKLTLFENSLKLNDADENEMRTNNNQNLLNIPDDKSEMDSIILSENCSEPIEYNGRLLLSSEEKLVDNSENIIKIDTEKEICSEDTIIKPDKKSYNEIEGDDILSRIKKFALKLTNSCSKLKISPEQSVEKFYHEQLLEFKEICPTTIKSVLVQTEFSGNLYSEKGLKKLNEHEKLKLLRDSSSSCSSLSSGSSLEDVSDHCSDNSDSLDSSYENGILEDDDSDDDDDDDDKGESDECNGMDLSEYIEKDDVNESKLSESNKQEKIDEIKQNNVTKTKSRNEKKNQMDSDEDKEIDRLLNFKNLDKAQISSADYNYNDTEKTNNLNKSKSKKPIEINQETNFDSSDGTDSEIDDNVITEKEFLVKQNEESKRNLLNSSSSSESSEEEITLEKYEDDSNSALVTKYIEMYEANDDDEDEDEEEEIDKSEKNAETKVSLPPKSLSDDEKEVIKENNDEKEKLKKEDVDGNESDRSKSDVSITKFVKKPNRRKSFQALVSEDEKRRKNNKSADELINVSSSDDSEIDEVKNDAEPSQIRPIRQMMRQDQLTSETKVAQKAEESRILRLKNKESILKKAFKEHKIDSTKKDELILDYNTKTKEFIKVDPDLLKHLKDHQIEGIKFMYDSCYGSVNFIDEHPGSGCILAHCMGLGKTLQLITLLYTVVSHKQLNTCKILVLCPKSTVMNWADELTRWLKPINNKKIRIFTFCDTSDVKDKLTVLKQWSSCGKKGRDSGCLLIGYEAFRTLVSYHHTYRKRNTLSQTDLENIQRTVKETLLKPGADLVVCDEGHIIKNRKAAISQAVTEISTRRRIILTGTPIQNNLKEYYSMVDFIKPYFLGTEKEFANLYGNPIRQGQHKDSSKRDIKLMKQRSFVLHKKLSSFVQRREAALLKTFLPKKFEYVLFVPLSSIQTKLYKIFLDSVAKRDDSKRNLLTDYTCLRKIWTHPKVLENAWMNATSKQKNVPTAKRNVNLLMQSDDDEPDDIYDSQTGFMSVTSDWWRVHLSKSDLETILPSNKLKIMFEILKICKENREKCLIFSAFVAVLNVVEYFMNRVNDQNLSGNNEDNLGIENYTGPWVNGKDYYRLDGKTAKTLRHELIKSFNDPTNERARVFLISAKAGGQGINLISANRVIILDTSWNPSNDQQNIFRIFRLGQQKNCYIYRLLSYGTMEEKVYSRSVTKQAMSFRVVDEHQIDRHYSMAELAELDGLNQPDYSERPVPILPQDSILAHLLRNHPNLVYKYHEHDSLLENKIEQELSEQDKKDAWLLYERDTNQANVGFQQPFPNLDYMGNLAQPYLPHLDLYGASMRAVNGQLSSPYLPGYVFPSTGDSYHDLLAMYQTAQNYPSSMYGLDAASRNPFASNNLLQGSGRNGPLSNILPSTSNNLTSFSSNLLSLANDLNRISPSPYAPSLYSSHALNHSTRTSYIDSLQKTLENFPSSTTSNLLSSSWNQRPLPQMNQNSNPFQSNFMLNDLQSLNRNPSSTESIPTSVIRKNDILLKKCNEQVKSLPSNNNLMNTLLMKQNYNQPSNLEITSCVSLQKLPETNLSSTNKQKQNENIQNLNNSSNSTSNLSGKPVKDRSKETSPVISSNNEPRPHKTNMNEQNLFKNISQAVTATTTTTATTPSSATTKSSNNTPLNSNFSNTPAKSNAKFKENALKTLNNTVNKFSNPVSQSSMKLPGTVETNISKKQTEENLKSKSNTTKYSGTNKVLSFNDNINQSVVVSNLQRDQNLTKKKSNIGNIISQDEQNRNKMNSDLLESGKTTYKNITISNLSKISEKITNSNSSLSITQPVKSTSGITISNNSKQLQSSEKEINQRKRPATVAIKTLHQNSTSNSLNDLEIKRSRIFTSKELPKMDITNSLRKVQLSKDLTIVPPVLKSKIINNNKAPPPAVEVFELD